MRGVNSDLKLSKKGEAGERERERGGGREREREGNLKGVGSLGEEVSLTPASLIQHTSL